MLRLGEMISNLSSSGVNVPGGFATTAQAYRDFLAHEGLDKRIEEALSKLNVDDVVALAEAGRKIRGWIVEAPLPKRLELRFASITPNGTQKARAVSPYALLPQPKTCRMPLLPGSKRLF
jgi:phosphoenolpyruvate synthase/pyruvate phosphate dikinase